MGFALRKKGSITDLPFILIGILTVGFVAFLVAVVVNSFDDEFQKLDVLPDNAKSASTKLSTDFPQVMNGGVVFIFFGAVFVSLILASLIPAHPIFLPIFILEWLIVIWLGGGIANTYQQLVELAIFAKEKEQFAFTVNFFRYLPFFVGVAGAVLAAVIYKAKRSFGYE